MTNYMPLFYLSCIDMGDPTTPFECECVSEHFVIQTGQKIYRVKIFPVFKKMLEGRIEEIDTLLLGVVDRRRGLDTVADGSFVVDVCISRSPLQGQTIDSKDLYGFGIGELFLTKEAAEKDLYKNSFDPVPRRPDEQLSAKNIVFIKEQDGDVERIIKERWRSIFQASGVVDRAYLARIHYGNPKEFHVALCLKTRTEPDKEFEKRVSAAFARIFKTNEHVDILIMNDEQENRVSTVCQPFYKE